MAHSLALPFQKYLTIHSFTGTIHSNHKHCAAQAMVAAHVQAHAAQAQAYVTLASVPASVVAPSAPVLTVEVPRVGPQKHCCLTKSKAIAKNTSDEEASTVAAMEEDTIMGNLNIPASTQPTDLMVIDDDVKIVINQDPSSGNIIEGHKVSLPKFIKHKNKSYLVHHYP
ncbi:uncharacterized protein BT62DRAFT_923831 [Guyanagaster necrorhizus]|uniref:Uncharacterized protein n=1 Tax=Guyanagaster necrorhizus TaxID=856835 RepID=A0A9P7VIS5_9AGAR|nr:uncharacterized protein BT62DRAFT_923831 [Guyanagaster necrorhizus MCA 3950]KAG7440801.1 hypothetical protein BT62DRAFT_923831 [Guyanagaster necrorhizus MCA 3950]